MESRTARLHGHPVAYGLRDSRPALGHIPPLEAPARPAAGSEGFIEQTEPGRFDATGWRARFPTSGESPRGRGVRRAAG